MEWAAPLELVVLILVLQVVIVIIDIALYRLTMQAKLIQRRFYSSLKYELNLLKLEKVKLFQSNLTLYTKCHVNEKLDTESVN